MIGVGFAWASILSLPYAMLSTSVPSKKMGVYMGIFNFFIVIPQLLAASVLGLILRHFFDNQPIYAYLGKYGALVQKGEKDSEECQYAGLLKDQTLDTITLKDAMKLLSYPKELGLINKKKVIIKRGRYGFYIQHGNNTCSLDKECDVDSLTIKNIKQYLTDNQDKILGTYKKKDIYLKTGKYGPYIQYQKKNYSIKDNTITLEEAIEIVQYPKKLGTHEKKQIVLAKGKYGYYLQYQKKNYSLGKIDPKSITLKTAITIINKKTTKKTSKK